MTLPVGRYPMRERDSPYRAKTTYGYSFLYKQIAPMGQTPDLWLGWQKNRAHMP